jgi:hypothetical protein
MPPPEPAKKRTIAFFDGQNLYRAALDAFGVPYPNFDPIALAEMICSRRGWTLDEVRFYTGIPSAGSNLHWHTFWNKRFAIMKRKHIYVYSREINPTTGKEKGIDIRIALDMVSLFLRNLYDVALLFSQDQDFSEVADEVYSIAREQGRWVKIATAFPESSTYTNRRGVNKTEWIRINLADYNSCLDPRDYHP